MSELTDKLNYKSSFVPNKESENNIIQFRNYNSKNDLNNRMINYGEEAATMDNGDPFIFKFMDKIEDSNKQLKHDVEESEKRIHNERLELDKKITEEQRLSEERMEKKFNETMKAIEKLSDKIDSKVEKIESKVDNTNKWIIATCLATIVGIAAMVATIVLAK